VFSRPLRRQVIVTSSGSTGFWSGLSLDSKRLTAVGVALLLAMVVAVGIAIWNMRVVALKDARQNDAKLGTAVAEQTARSIQGIDLILLMLRAQITEQTNLSASTLQTTLQTPTIQKELARLQQSLPQSDAFSIVDSRGHLVNFSRHWPVPQINLSDRGYFRHFRDHDDLNALVSKVMRNRSTGTWTFYVARRLDGAQGQFLGLVLGAVDLTYFQEFYQSLTTGASFGMLATRHPL
jgi:hypothetical protein